MRFWLMTAICMLSGTVQAATLTGRVVSVKDGHSIMLVDTGNTHYKIRLAGIYAPGLKQAYGGKSKQNLSDLVLDKQVKIEWDKRDKHKRILGKVLFTPAVCVTPECVLSVDANREQIATGNAWHNSPYAKEQSATDRDTYAAAEKQAREAKRGLWADANLVPPWEKHRPR